MSRTEGISASQLSWLDEQLHEWARDGLIDDTQVARIRGRYHAVRRLTLARLLLSLGGVFAGFGVIWLVAANIDALPPLARFLFVAALWLSVTVGAELLAGRVTHAGKSASPVVAGVRTLAVLTFGAVVFQAAQSLQVPADEPRLLGIWALGAFAHAYLVSARISLLVGLSAGSAWLLWRGLMSDASSLTAVLLFVALGVAATGVAQLHSLAPLARFAAFANWWRATGALWLLVGLFTAALPFVNVDGYETTPFVTAALVVAAVVALAGLAMAVGRERLEPAGALLVAGVAWILVVWDEGSDPDAVTAAAVAHAAVAVVTYALTAGGIAALGVMRDNGLLTGIATAALVIFTTFQGFAVFAPIMDGAWLFLTLGLLFLGTGYAADRARRQLAVSLEGELA